MIDSETIRRAIAWVLCDTMPPNDERLREIYGDAITLEALGVGDDERLALSSHFEIQFSLSLVSESAHEWSTVGDVIAFVQSQFANRNSQIQ